MLQVIQKVFFILAAVLIAAAVPTVARAQSYPNKPIRVVIPFPPGGTADVVVRILGPKIGETLGQPVVIENRSGASGTIGSAAVAKSPPDGYTLVLGTMTTITVVQKLYSNLPYDPIKDLQPISRLGMVPSLLIVHPSLPANSVPDLVKLAKSQPGKLTYGSAGAGTAQHLAVELFKYMTGTDILHVPYKGGAPAMADLLGGQIVMNIEPLNTALPNVRTGKLRGIAVTTAARIPALPDVPAVSETLPDYESTLWFSLHGPSGMPNNIVALLNAAIVKSLRAPEIRERMAVQNVDPIGDSVQDFTETIRRESSKWAALVEKIGLKLD